MCGMPEDPNMGAYSKKGGGEVRVLQGYDGVSAVCNIREVLRLAGAR